MNQTQLLHHAALRNAQKNPSPTMRAHYTRSAVFYYQNMLDQIKQQKRMDELFGKK
jgi:hypothetical protein